MSHGHIDVLETDGNFVMSLVGPIDENMPFKKIQFENPKTIVMNFQKVTSVKSYGIRELIRWLNLHKTCKITYSLCPKMVVDQINIVDGFLPKNGFVESFYVPYYSEDTSEESQVLFRIGIEFDGSNITPPREVLDSKGNKMELDAIWSKYFYFLENKERRRTA